MRERSCETSHTVKLGTGEALRKQGRYGRVMGDHWRSDAREKLTFAANGLLMDIWSYCADQATDAVSLTAMRKLTAPDQKNAGRMLKQLVAAGYLAATTLGWTVLGWQQLNPVAKRYPLAVVSSRAQTGSEEAETRVETRLERKPPPEIIEETPLPRARALTQDPVVKGKSDSPTESPAASAGPPKSKLKPPRKAPGPDPLKTAVVEAYAAAFERAHDVPPGRPNWALVQTIVSWARLMPDPEAAIRLSCEGYFGSWSGKQSSHPMHLWAKNPAGFCAEAQHGRPQPAGRYQESWREGWPAATKIEESNAEEIIAYLESFPARAS